MIKRIFAIAAVALAGLLPAPRAEAGHSHHSRLTVTYQSGRSSCGCPIYTRRFVRGYDCHHRPIFGYVRVPLAHGSSCGHRVHRVRHQHHHHPVRPVLQRPVFGARIVINGGRYASRHGGYHPRVRSCR